MSSNLGLRLGLGFVLELGRPNPNPSVYNVLQCLQRSEKQINRPLISSLTPNNNIPFDRKS